LRSTRFTPSTASICAGIPGAVQAIAQGRHRSQDRALHEPSRRSFDIELPNGERYQREIPRAQFEQLIEPVLERTAARASRR
jgi:hypothetical protein